MSRDSLLIEVKHLSSYGGKKILVFLVSVAQTYVEVNGRGKRGKAEVQAVSSSELG